MKRVIALLMAAICLTATACAESKTEEKDKPQISPQEAARFSDMKFEYPDVQKINSDLEKLNSKMDAGGDTTELIKDYRRLYDLSDNASGQYCLLNVYTSMNVNDADLEEKYNKLSLDITNMSNYLSKLGARLCQEDEFKDYFTPSEIRQIKANSAVMTDNDVDNIVQRQQELTNKYNKLSASGNRSMETVNAIGQVYLDIIKVNKEMAKVYGFDSYEEMMYATYSRDYTPEDADKLAESIRTQLVPVYKQYREKLLKGYNSAMNVAYSYEKSCPDIKKALSQYIPELSKAWSFMHDHELIDMSTDSNRSNVCYTTYFQQYDCPFIFGQWYGGVYGVETIIHEFGHFYSSYKRKGMDGIMDLSEVDSQALVLLLMDSQAEVLCGERNAEDAQVHVLEYSIERLLERLILNRLQKFAYNTENLTVDMVSEEFVRLLDEYGLSGIYNQYFWAYTYHTVCYPFYDISYTTSMLVSLQLWELAQSDRDAAREKYRSIVNREQCIGFKEHIKACGIDSPFEEATIKSLANVLRQYAEGLE